MTGPQLKAVRLKLRISATELACHAKLSKQRLCEVEAAAVVPFHLQQALLEGLEAIAARIAGELLAGRAELNALREVA